jgi:hypothetical protein
VIQFVLIIFNYFWTEKCDLMVIFEKFESPEKNIFANELLKTDICERQSGATLDISDILFEICGGNIFFSKFTCLHD